MQLLGQTWRFCAIVVLCSCFLAGCDALGGDDLCDGRDGLFIQTDRDSYQVGDEATLTVENCTGGALFIERAHSAAPDYNLEKRIGDEWEVVSIGEILDARLVQVGSDDSYEFILPVEPSADFVDGFPGTYRYEIDIRDGQQTEDQLPKQKRVSNTFEITE